MSVCPNCQAENAEGSAVCSACGVKLTSQPVVPSRTNGRDITSFMLRFLSVVIYTGLILVCISILYPIFIHSHGNERMTRCVSNQRQIAMAELMFAQEHEEQFPASSTFWNNGYVSPVICGCPEKPTQMIGYGFNKTLGGRKVGSISDPSSVILTADACEVGQVTNHSLIKNERDLDYRHEISHEHYCFASFLDGHVIPLKVGTPVRLR